MTVYFISDGEYVKIGFTDGPPEKRLKALQTGSSKKLMLLKIVPGDRSVEKQYQDLLKRHKADGGKDWFYFNKEVKSFMSMLSGQTGSFANVLTKNKVKALLADRFHSCTLEEKNDVFTRIQISRDWFDRAYEYLLYSDGLRYLCCDGIREWLDEVNHYDSSFRNINDLYMESAGCSVVITALDSAFKLDSHKRLYNSLELYPIYKKWFEPVFYNDKSWKDHCSYISRKTGGDYFIAQKQDAFWSFVDNVVARAYIKDQPYLRIFEPERKAYFDALFCGGFVGSLRSHFKSHFCKVIKDDAGPTGVPGRLEMALGFFYFCEDHEWQCIYEDGYDPRIAI